MAGDLYGRDDWGDHGSPRTPRHRSPDEPEERGPGYSYESRHRAADTHDPRYDDARWDDRDDPYRYETPHGMGRRTPSRYDDEAGYPAPPAYPASSDYASRHDGSAHYGGAARYEGGYGRSDRYDGAAPPGYQRPAGGRTSGAPGRSPNWRNKVRAKRKNMPLWQELPLLLIVAFCLAVLIRTFLLQAFFIPSGSMEDTLLIGDRVLVNKVVYDFRDPTRGEVVVFAGPPGWAPDFPVDPNVGFFTKLGRTVGDLVGISAPSEKDFIKRVIGLPGDTVACCDNDGRLTVNAFPLDESAYVIRNSSIDVPPSPTECRSRRFGPIVVEPGQLFVMGDHRAVSQDSRCYGQIPIENVVGRAFAIVWPSDRWTTLPVPEIFKDVPKPVAAPALGPHEPRPQIRVPGAVPAVFMVPFAASWLVPARSRRRAGTEDVRSRSD